MAVPYTHSANTKIKSAEANANNTYLEGLANFSGINLIKRLSAVANQAQSLTTTYATITGFADEDSGWIVITAGGNMPADRVMRRRAFAWYRTGGTMNISAGSSQPIDINVTSGALTLLATASAGGILVQIQTSAFGAGAFKGNVMVEIGSNNTNMSIA